VQFAEAPNAPQDCAYVATLADLVGDVGTEADVIGQIMVSTPAAGTPGIDVITHDSDGVIRDVGDPEDGTGEGGFHLAVFCP
jgi:hypothetical protein